MEARLLAALGQRFHKILPVHIAAKNGLLAIATAHQVVDEQRRRPVLSSLRSRATAEDAPSAPVLRRNGHILPFDTLVHHWQRGEGMSETQNQFSLTRVASIIGVAAKKQIPISLNRRHFIAISSFGAIASMSGGCLPISSVTPRNPSAAFPASRESTCGLLPFPQQIRSHGLGCAIAEPSFSFNQPVTGTLGIAMESLRRYAGDAEEKMKVRLGSQEKGYDHSWLSRANNEWLAAFEEPDASVLTITAEGITVVGRGEAGMLLGVQTINQLLIEERRRKSRRLPGLEIRDWPELQWRCLSPQLAWYQGFAHFEGFDLGNWSRDEWKWLVDFSLLHKANAWAVCMYGGWPFHLAGYEETTAQFDSFRFDPTTGKKTPRRYAHPNIEREFYPEVIRYANARGVRVHAYIGLNTFNGTYVLKHKEADAQSIGQAIPFTRGLEDYWRAYIKRILELGFNGFVFEEPEWYNVPNQNEECYRTFWEPWARKYGFASRSETDRNKPPLGVQVEYYCWLFHTFDQMIQEAARALEVQPEVFIIGHILLNRIMQEVASPEEREYWFALIDAKRGRKIRCILFEDNEREYAALLGGSRVATLGGRGGAAAGFHRSAMINLDRTHGDIGQDLAEERDKQQRMVLAGGFGSMAYIFQWTHAEVFAYLGCQYQWRHTGVPRINNQDAFGFMDYAYQRYYGDEAGALAAQAYSINSCVEEGMVPLHERYFFSGYTLGREARLLASMADQAEGLALAAYRAFTKVEPDLRHRVYESADFKWDGYDPAQDRLFKTERLRLLAVSTHRARLLADAALRWRRANALLARGGSVLLLWEDLSAAAAEARESELLYYDNYDEHYTIGATGADVAARLKKLADQVLEATSLTAAQVRQYKGPLPEPLRKLAEPADFVVWEKLTDILPERRPANGELFLTTSLGLASPIEYFCLGTVFTIQLRHDADWKTIMRRGLTKKDSGWQEWDIPLGSVHEQNAEPFQLRFMTESFTRAAESDAPTWKWAFWGEPRLVRRDRRGRTLVVVDFLRELSKARCSVLLHKDGVTRPFDNQAEDSTGATFNAIASVDANAEHAPLPARPCIAAFAPYRNGAFGMTLAEFEIDLHSMVPLQSQKKGQP